MSGDYFIEGANYGFDPEYGSSSKAYADMYKNLSWATDARTANQLRAASDKLNAGATAIEISTIGPDVFETIPKQHFQELNRLRKLVGKNVELTLHAPLVEPTGLTKRGWDEHEREQAERQMFDAIEKAHELNPEGNVVTTFHASIAGLPAETVVWEGKEGEKKKVVKDIVVIDENTGDFKSLSMKPSPFLSEEEAKTDIKKKIENFNKEQWHKPLQHLAYATREGSAYLEKGLESFKQGEGQEIEEGAVLKIYKDYAEGKTENFEKALEKVEPALKEVFEAKMQAIVHGDLYLRDAYTNVREIFDQAYKALEKSDSKNAKESKAKLDAFRERIKSKVTTDYLESPDKVKEMAQIVREGVHVLRSIETSQIPQTLRPLKDFAIDKSSETFSNLAINAYDKFKDHSPVISLENHPAGQAIITSGTDIRKLIEETRSKFEKKAVEKFGMSEEKAKAEAEKLIGATWDVGHINQLRKFGAGDKELVDEAKAIAPMLKHVHLSDNFGLENIELPMGMGNVPSKAIFEEFRNNAKNFDKIKKVVEIGNWWQPFQATPFQEFLQEYGSPIYAPSSGNYFGGSGYFAGFGTNPDIHHAIYGAGFANLPVELGGQMSGRSRVSGAPIE